MGLNKYNLPGHLCQFLFHLNFTDEQNNEILFAFVFPWVLRLLLCVCARVCVLSRFSPSDSLQLFGL